MSDGLRRAGGHAPGEEAFAMGFYGDLFRPPGGMLALGDPRYTAADVQEGFEQDLLFAWRAAASRADNRVAAPGADTLVRAPRSVQAALRALSTSRFFSGIALRHMILDLKQVRLYLEQTDIRLAAQERVTKLIDEETRVVVAHSLGSVVAYEALCSLPEHGVQALVTMGSPIGIPMIFERLAPEPGSWPGGDRLAWTNIVDQGDVVALVKDLRPLFGTRVQSIQVANGAHAHDASAYLTDPLTGTAILRGLRGE